MESLVQINILWDEVGGRGEGGVLPGRYNKFLKENLKTKSDPARAECDDATSLKSRRIWVVSWGWIKPNQTTIWMRKEE